MKLLHGKDLADFIQERQAKQVRNLRQAEHVTPTLAIVRCDQGNSVIDTYVRMKQRYGGDILIDVRQYQESIETIRERIRALNADETVHGIIVQLPVVPAEATDEILELVAPEKDVDGLGQASQFDPATPVAINWLLAGYGVELKHKRIALVGSGRLVGAPLARMWRQSHLEVAVYEKSDAERLPRELPEYDVIVAATGAPGIITADMLRAGAVVVDAGTASENGVIVGDVGDDVYQRADLTLTPKRGGVGPLTVAALFDNVITAARRTAQLRQQ